MLSLTLLKKLPIAEDGSGVCDTSLEIYEELNEETWERGDADADGFSCERAFELYNGNSKWFRVFDIS